MEGEPVQVFLAWFAHCFFLLCFLFFVMLITPELILNDPASSTWIKNALLSALERDPVDAANDAEVLAIALQEWCDAVLAKNLDLP